MDVPSEARDQASEEDRAFVKALVGNAKAVVDSKLLRALLGAFDLVSVSPVQELPLELVVLDVTGEGK